MDCVKGVDCATCFEQNKDWVRNSSVEFCCYGFPSGDWNDWLIHDTNNRCPPSLTTTTMNSLISNIPTSRPINPVIHSSSSALISYIVVIVSVAVFAALIWFKFGRSRFQAARQRYRLARMHASRTQQLRIQHSPSPDARANLMIPEPNPMIPSPIENLPNQLEMLPLPPRIYSPREDMLIDLDEEEVVVYVTPGKNTPSPTHTPNNLPIPVPFTKSERSPSPQTSDPIDTPTTTTRPTRYTKPINRLTYHHHR